MKSNALKKIEAKIAPLDVGAELVSTKEAMKMAGIESHSTFKKKIEALNIHPAYRDGNKLFYELSAINNIFINKERHTNIHIHNGVPPEPVATTSQDVDEKIQALVFKCLFEGMNPAHIVMIHQIDYKIVQTMMAAWARLNRAGIMELELMERLASVCGVDMPPFHSSHIGPLLAKSIIHSIQSSAGTHPCAICNKNDSVFCSGCVPKAMTRMHQKTE